MNLDYRTRRPGSLWKNGNVVSKGGVFEIVDKKAKEGGGLIVGIGLEPGVDLNDKCDRREQIGVPSKYASAEKKTLCGPTHENRGGVHILAMFFLSYFQLPYGDPRKTEPGDPLGCALSPVLGCKSVSAMLLPYARKITCLLAVEGLFRILIFSGFLQKRGCEEVREIDMVCRRINRTLTGSFGQDSVICRRV